MSRLPAADRALYAAKQAGKVAVAKLVGELAQGAAEKRRREGTETLAR